MEEVRRLRQAKGWNQNELAFHADLAPSVISLLETGKREPNATTLRKLAEALEVRIPDLFEDSGSGKAQRRSSLEPSLFNGVEDERRLSMVAHQLLMLGEHLLQTWEAELPERARSNDDEWLGNTAGTWHMLGEINLGVLEELGADRLHDKQKWLARYMDVNATVHRLNATIRAHSDSDMVPYELLLETLPKTA
jgi:transcriptional regulator with XRE-family HTH domain